MTKTGRSFVYALVAGVMAAAVLVSAIAYFETRPSSVPQQSPFMRVTR